MSAFDPNMNGLKSWDSFGCVLAHVFRQERGCFLKCWWLLKYGVECLATGQPQKCVGLGASKPKKCVRLRASESKNMLSFHIVLSQNLLWINYVSSSTKVLLNFAVEILVETPPFLGDGVDSTTLKKQKC